MPATQSRIVLTLLTVAMLGSATLTTGTLRAQVPQTEPLAPPRAYSKPAIDQARLYHNLSVLAADSMEGRRTGSRGSERARAFLISEFARIGLKPAVRGYAMSFLAKLFEKGGPPPCNGVPRPGQFCETKGSGSLVDGINLLGVVTGTAHPDRFIVVSAHYDHLGVVNGVVYNGSDDNASGTAAILSIAEWTVAHPPLNSIIFAWFDAEESGLMGSTAFAKRPPVELKQIAADVNVDMVSHSARGELYAAGARRYPVMQSLVDSIRADAFVTLLQGHDGVPPADDWTDRSDMAPFHCRGIPFIDFSNGEHEDYHRPTDKFERTTPEFYFLGVLTIAEFIGRLDQSLDEVAAVRAKGRRSLCP